MKKTVGTILVLLGCSFLLLSVQSDFNLGLEDWRSEGDGEFSWEPVNGHPAGCFRVDDDATGDINRAYAPNKFLGDWSDADGSGTLSADFNAVFGGPYLTQTCVFKIKGPGGSAKAIEAPTPPYDIWINYSVPINSANWTIISGSWEAILEDVRSLVLAAEFVDGDEYVKIDNVTLSFDPINLPVQNGVISDFEEVGYDGWYYTNTNSVINQVGGGNPSRFIKVDGNNAFTEGVAPAKFTGSWELVENYSAVFVDLKKISSNIDWDEPQYLFKISGDGGTAKFPVPDDFDLSLSRWETFMAYITEEEWVVINGDWDSLMTDVSEVRLALDFYTTGSVIGMDNFRINNEPPESYFIADETEVWAGEEISFTDYSTNSPETWLWQFGDNTSSTAQNPLHVYQNPGSYDVTLITENIFGADTLTRISYIEVTPTIPQHLNISVVTDSVYLNWQSVAGANSYKIYGADDPLVVFDSLDVVADTTWKKNISELNKKFYYVTAIK